MFGTGWKGKLGGILFGLGGLVKAIVPDHGALIDQVVDVVISIGGGLGIFGIREALGPSRHE